MNEDALNHCEDCKEAEEYGITVCDDLIVDLSLVIESNLDDDSCLDEEVGGREQVEHTHTDQFKVQVEDACSQSVDQTHKSDHNYQQLEQVENDVDGLSEVLVLPHFLDKDNEEEGAEEGVGTDEDARGEGDV